MQRQSLVRQIAIGALLGFAIALIHALAHVDPDPMLSPHGLSRLVAGAVGGALVYVAAYRALHRTR
jgi:hypothetical protein